MAPVNPATTNFDSITLDEYLLYSMPVVNDNNQVEIPKLQLKTFKGLDNQPKLAVSELAKMFQHYTLDYLPVYFGKDKSRGKFTNMLAHTRMFHYYPGAFKVLDMCYLEIHSLLWHMENAPDLLRYISKVDIERLRYNLRVMADWCGSNDEYYDFIIRLRKLDVDLGFIENKIQYIINNFGYAS